MNERRRFPAPWRVRELDECFIVEDANGVALSYHYFVNAKALGTAAAGRLERDDARQIAANFARLPDLLSSKK